MLQNISSTVYKKITVVALTACLCGSLTSCFKEVDVDQVTPQAGVIQKTPSAGPKNTILNLSGVNFPDKAGIVVKVNGKVIPIVASTGNNIQAQIPQGTGSGKVEVTFNGATYDAGNFTYENTFTVTSYSNGQVGYLDGPIATAKFEDIEGLTVDANDNMYNAQYGAPRVRKINLNTGMVTTLTSGAVGNEEFISNDAAGNVYVADETGRAIKKIDQAGTVTTVASVPFTPHGIKVGASGNIYVSGAGSGNIAKYSPTGTLLWRLSTHGAGNVDGDTSVVKFLLVGNLEIDPTETKIYVNNATGGIPNQIKVLDLTTKTMKVIAGSTTSGYSDGDAMDAHFNYIYSTRLDKNGGLYIVDLLNNRIRYYKDGKVTTVIGGAGGDLDGVGTAAKLSNPQDIAFDSKGNMYIADYGNSKIKKVVID